MERSRLMIALKLIVSLVICQLAGLIGSFFTTPSIGNWYAYLDKPSFSPPNWVFAPVWTILFLIMGIALFIVLLNKQKEKESDVKLAIGYFAVQLILNVLWSLVFFTFQSPLAGIVVIVLLLISILLTIIKFAKISELAGYILIPYILWVGFATALNIVLFILNK